MRPTRSQTARSSSFSHDKKLNGRFPFVKIRPRENEHGDPWLLIKDRDEHADAKSIRRIIRNRSRAGKSLDGVPSTIHRLSFGRSKRSARHATMPRLQASVRARSGAAP